MNALKRVHRSRTTANLLAHQPCRSHGANSVAQPSQEFRLSFSACSELELVLGWQSIYMRRVTLSLLPRFSHVREWHLSDVPP